MELPLGTDDFTHARVIIGIVTGFSMARILTGVARAIQRAAPVDPVQLAWALYLALSVTHFWWFEFGLAPGGRWGFGLYLFAIAYAALFFFVCVILFPDPTEEAQGFATYFAAHRGWFYGLLAALVVADGCFAALKGAAHLRALGAPYLAKAGLMLALALVAALWADRRLDAGFAAVAILVQIWWILRIFGVAA